MNPAAREEKSPAKGRVGGRFHVEGGPGEPWVAFPRLSPPQVHIETERSGGTRGRERGDPASKRAYQTAGLGGRCNGCKGASGRTGHPRSLLVPDFNPWSRLTTVSWVEPVFALGARRRNDAWVCATRVFFPRQASRSASESEHATAAFTRPFKNLGGGGQKSSLGFQSCVNATKGVGSGVRSPSKTHAGPGCPGPRLDGVMRVLPGRGVWVPRQTRLGKSGTPDSEDGESPGKRDFPTGRCSRFPNSPLANV